MYFCRHSIGTNVFALYFILGFETLSTETLLTKINVFLHLQSKN
jgi:hypothetical protein